MAHATADLEDELNGMDWDMNDIASAAAQQALAGAATGGSKLPSAVSGPSGPPSHPKITVTLKRSSETVTVCVFARGSLVFPGLS